LSGVLLGFAVHFKIYPFIYAMSLVWFLESDGDDDGSSYLNRLLHFFNRDRLLLGSSSILTFIFFNVAMYALYGAPYIEHSWSYHLTRLDHRHNFSLYSTLLHFTSSPGFHLSMPIERWAFIPQLVLSAILIPIAMAKKDLAATMLCQTFAFVTFNKVCTSQYFLWYLIFLPLYMPISRLSTRPVVAFLSLSAWVLGQAHWLYEGYKLEFLGEQTFVPGLWWASILFYLTNCGILGLIIKDVTELPNFTPVISKTKVS